MLKESLISNCLSVFHFLFSLFICLYFQLLGVSLFSLFSNRFILIVPVGKFYHAALIISFLSDVSQVNVFRKTFHARSFTGQTKDGSGVESTGSNQWLQGDSYELTITG